MPHTFWPSVDDYTDAVLTPQDSFADADLRQSVPVDARGHPARDEEPQSWVGGAAVVFRMRSLLDATKEWAVKCFKKSNRDRQRRYRSLAAHLSGRKLPFLVDFHYLRDQDEHGGELTGILVDDEWFPAVKMGWVEGQTLRDVVQPRLQRPKFFYSLCVLWERLVQRLSEARLAHLDLQHGNVLWEPSERRLRAKLIDYDGMWIETLAQFPSGELGVEHYQHPDRHRQADLPPPYCAEVDRFSHLVIYTALRALAVGGDTVWRRYDNGENLLFKNTDFRCCRTNGKTSDESPLLHELWDQSDEGLPALVGRLILAAHGPLQSTPAFDDLVSDGQIKPLEKSEGERVEDICPWLPRRYRRTRSPILKVGTVVSNSLGMQLAWVPPGESWLGGGGGKPGTSRFVLEKGLYCGIYPVTQAEWREVMGNGPSYFAANPSYPVESVSWNQVQEFLKKLNAMTFEEGRTYRLPSEQEWEYICRGGPITQQMSQYDFYFAKSKEDWTPAPTNDLSSYQANFDGNFPAGAAQKGPYIARTSDVASYLSNPLGIYDMHGNVREWTDSLHTEGDSDRVVRGGGWFFYGEVCTASHRDWLAPGFSDYYLGFRILAVPSSQEVEQV